MVPDQYRGGNACSAARMEGLEVEFDDLNQARFTVQGLGAGAAVLAPRELRDAIDTEFARVTDLRRLLAAG